MILRFPQLDTLSLAITSGLIASEDVVKPAAARLAEDGGVWVESDIKLAREAKKQLGEWGVTGHRSKRKAGGELQAFASWLQIFPLRKVGSFQQPNDKTPVLFELQNEAALPEIVNEILRQGNDRQSFRSVADKHGERVLLRVLGPPYYTLLRALDQAAVEDAPRAFIEHAPRVWVQAGYQHPFAKQIKPKAGQHLLLEQPTQWRALKEQPFRDIYETLDFQLPAIPEPLQDDDRDVRLSVPIRLVRGAADGAAELFVLRRNAIRQLDDFVASASDTTLRRLSFVRIETKEDEEPVVLIRIRPGRGAPPVLVFDALACRPYLRIPNLFVPIGQRIHPPLRRDAVKGMLAADNANLVWLEPESDKDNAPGLSQQFVPRSVADSAFRPLSDWVDHTIERDADVMKAWVATHTFDFEGFVCPDEETKKKKKSQPRPKANSKDGDEPESTSDVDGSPKKDAGTRAKVVRKFRKPKPEPTDSEQAESKAKLQTLENEFTSLDAPLDDPQREPLWSRMAEVNDDLNRFADASICRQHGLWEQAEPPAAATLSWFHTEVAAARFIRTRSLGDDDAIVTDRHLKAWLANQTPSPAEVAQLAGFVTTAVQDDNDREIVRSQQAEVQRYLERHESALGVRANWLAWFSLASISGDVLMLARARDRLLSRLFETGLVADRDLPSFMRMSGTQAGDRFNIVRDRVAGLHQTVREWSHRNLGLASKHTLQYVDLMFAFGFARLGESSRSAALVREAGSELPRAKDQVHGWLFNAFSYRIQDPADQESLPEEMLQRLESIQRLDRYKVDRLREHSGILEPHERLDPYRRWRRKNENELQNELSALFDIVDRNELLDRLRKLFERSLEPDEKIRLVTTALELSPRLGEKFAGRMLGHVGPAEKKSQDVLLRAGLLEKGIHVAGHYDMTDASRELLDRMKQLIVKQRDAQVEVLSALESLMSQSFLTMRKLGMRDEVAGLLELLSDHIRPAGSKKPEPERLGVLLQLAGGWFYFGEDRGWKDIDTARQLLLRGTLRKQGHVGIKKQVDLACSYIRAVGRAPIDEAIGRFEELFQELDEIHDSATVNTHYSLKQLDIVEALILTIASDSFTMNQESQRWLDDEEFLIRRRVHRDVRAMMGS